MLTENLIVKKSDGWVQIPLGKVSICNNSDLDLELAFTENSNPPSAGVVGEIFMPKAVRIIEATQQAWVKTNSYTAVISAS